MSEKVRLSNIMRKGEETIVSMGPYDVVVQAQMDQFDNQKANESVKSSLNVIESETENDEVLVKGVYTPFTLDRFD